MAQQLFDFYGMALVPAMEGETLTMYSYVRDASPATTPLPLDFDNYEYTLVVTDLVLVTDAFPEVYANGTISLFQDNVTLADYAAPGTFGDGTAILSGVITSLNLYHMGDLIPGDTTGNATGTVDWTGGSNINDIAPEDQTGWVFLSPTNSRTESVEPGYDEAWDGKVEPETPIVDTEKVSWGELKARF